MADRNAMPVPGTNAMDPSDNRTLMQRIAPNLRDYLPGMVADYAQEALKYAPMALPARPTVMGGMRPTGNASIPLPPAELNASALGQEIGVRPANQPVRYPFSMALERLSSAGKNGPAAAANAEDNAAASIDKGFEQWAQRFLAEFEAEKTRNRFEVIPGDKKD